MPGLRDAHVHLEGLGMKTPIPGKTSDSGARHRSDRSVMADLADNTAALFDNVKVPNGIHRNPGRFA